MSSLYTKEKIIGTGTYGNVWLVKSIISHKTYILKEVKLTSLNSTERRLALTEVSILSQCKHRNIIRYKDAVIDHKNEVLSIFMEYADGGDLFTAIINQNGVPFKEYTVLTWFVQITSALRYIHHKNIIHRDLKTRNIFLTRDKQIKVGDFGIARCLFQTNDLATTAIGTPYYLSPEICERKPYNYKSDIWALGCILFEMAALSHPFQACSFPHLISLILTGQRKELPRNCSCIIKELVQLILDDNPESRPSTDEILALSNLQPYLSELWLSQSRTNSLKHSSQEMKFRRYSLCDSLKSLENTQSERRASLSAVDSETTKEKSRTVSQRNDTENLRKSRSHSVNLKRTFSCSSKEELTYKVLHTTPCKRRAIHSTDSLPVSRVEKKIKIAPSNRGNGFRSYYQIYDESDCGYQSEEMFKNNSVTVSQSEAYNMKTSTKKEVDIQNLLIDESSIKDDVFKDEARLTSGTQKLNIAEPSDHNHCSHSQCQQCMLDIMWKNRLRGTVRTLRHNSERSEFIEKLKVVFRGNLFDSVYQALVSNWEENESSAFPKALHTLVDNLNYGQLTHLPLMMQLIQLDLVTK